MIREIVRIDEDLCDGCGHCVPTCAEGAIKLVRGKARIASDRLCDGLGACLGHCPRGAITIERREAAAFDESIVRPHAVQKPAPGLPIDGRFHNPPPARLPDSPGCPGSRLMQFSRPESRALHGDVRTTTRSALTHWPVQLRLLPPAAPILKGCRLLVAADCVPVAYAEFHQKLLAGRAVAIACPKFDDRAGQVERLTEIIRLNDLEEITVARMEVPCCRGIVLAVLEARRLAGARVAVKEVVIGTRGSLIAEQLPPATSEINRGCPA